jgi:predicted nucleic acid-binding protein
LTVLDNSVIVPALLEAPHSRLAQEAFRRASPIAVPPLWRHEFLNVLAICARRRSLGAPDWALVWRRALETFGPLEQQPDPLLALELAIRYSITGYDAQYVALARQLHSPLLTEDRELLDKFPDITVTIEQFVAGSRAPPGLTEDQH